MMDATFSKQLSFKYLEDLKNQFYIMVPEEKYKQGYAYLLTHSKFEDYLKSRMVTNNNK